MYVAVSRKGGQGKGGRELKELSFSSLLFSSVFFFWGGGGCMGS